MKVSHIRRTTVAEKDTLFLFCKNARQYLLIGQFSPVSRFFSKLQEKTHRRGAKHCMFFLVMKKKVINKQKQDGKFITSFPPLYKYAQMSRKKLLDSSWNFYRLIFDKGYYVTPRVTDIVTQRHTLISIYTMLSCIHAFLKPEIVKKR